MVFFLTAREALISFLIPFLELARCATREKLQFFNEREEKRVWIFFLFFSSSSLLPSFPILLYALFARCIFHHPNPFYAVSKVLMFSAAQKKNRFLNVLKCMFECVLCFVASRKNNTAKRKAKSYQTFFIMHILIFGTDFFCSFFSKNAFLGECRGERMNSS